MKSNSLRHAVARGLFHSALGLALAASLLLFPRLMVLAALAIATAVFLSIEFATLRMPHLRQWLVGRFAILVRNEENSKLTGASYFLIGCLITASAFPQEIASLAIVYLSLGDPAASIVGRCKGNVRLWNKSFEGNLACLLVCLVAGSILAGILGKPPLAVMAVGAIFASLFQALPLRLNDNMTIPVGSAAAMIIINVLV